MWGNNQVNTDTWEVYLRFLMLFGTQVENVEAFKAILRHFINSNIMHSLISCGNVWEAHCKLLSSDSLNLQYAALH